MKRLSDSLICLILIFAVVFNNAFMPSQTAGAEKADLATAETVKETMVDFKSFELTDEQLSAVDLMNHLTVVMYEINDSQNNRMFLDKTFNMLINYLDAAKIDQHTKQQINNILDTIKTYVMVDVKRERLQYILEQGQANAMRSAVPDPIAMLNVVQARNPIKAIASIAYMAVDSISNYTSAASEAETAFIQNNWDLDDEAKNAFYDVRQEWFNYKVNMAQTFGLKSNMYLNEEQVETFIKYKNSTQVATKRRSLEAHQSEYQLFSAYWLELAKSYYESDMYKECLKAMNTYQALSTQIYSQNREFANVLPQAITSAREVYDDLRYAEVASEYCQLILMNSSDQDWSLRYFAAVTYIDLYTKTGEQKYIDEAYRITFNNAMHLKEEQLSLNEKYVQSFVKEKAPAGSTKARTEEIKKYNELREKERNTELAPVYEPLLINLNLLFSLAKKIVLPENEKADIDRVLHESETPLFLDENLCRQFWIDKSAAPAVSEYEIKLEKNLVSGVNILSVPATFISTSAVVSVTYTDGDEKIPAYDWKVTKVDRKKSTNPSDFIVRLESTESKHWFVTNHMSAELVISFATDSEDKVFVSETFTGSTGISFGVQAVSWERVK